MFFVKILIFAVPVVIGILIFDYIKDYKKNHWYIRCSNCGFTDTEYKDNDKHFIRYISPGRQPIDYTEKGIPTFICKYCSKEFNLSEGEWVKNPIMPEKVEVKNNEKSEN